MATLFIALVDDQVIGVSSGPKDTWSYQLMQIVVQNNEKLFLIVECICVGKHPLPTTKHNHIFLYFSNYFIID